MTFPPLLQFAADHPGIAFLLSLPTAAVLMVLCHVFANGVVSIWLAACQTMSQIVAMVCTTIRPPEPLDDDDKDKDEKGGPFAA